MSPLHHVEPALSDGIVTRSDRMPTARERYGIWARKFFGYDWQEPSRVERESPASTHARAPVH